MMRVGVDIGFSFKRALSEDYRELDLPSGADVETAIRTFAERHPTARDRLLDDTGAVRRHVAALVNGGNVTRKRGFKTVLQEGDRLTLLPPVGGG